MAEGSVGNTNSSLEAAEALRREVGAALRTDIAEILTLELRDTANSILLDLDHALQRLQSLPPFEKVLPRTLAGSSLTSNGRLSEANAQGMEATNKVRELKRDNAGDISLSPIGNAAATAAVTGLHFLSHTEGKAKHPTEPNGDCSLLSLPSPEAVQLQWSSTDGDNIPGIISSGKAGLTTSPNSTLGRLQLSISSSSLPAGYGSNNQDVSPQPFHGSGKQISKVIVPGLKIDAVGQRVGNGSIGSSGAGGGVASGSPEARLLWNQPSSPRFVLSEPGLVTPARRRPAFGTPTQTPQPQSQLQSMQQLSVSPDATGGAAVADLRSQSLPLQHPVGAEGGPSPAAAGEWKGRHAGLTTVVSRQRRRNPQGPPGGYVSLLHCVKSAVLTLICRTLRTWSGQPVKLTSGVQSDAVRLRVTISKVKYTWDAYTIASCPSSSINILSYSFWGGGAIFSANV